ncbi:hypothetical protein GCM10023238_28550 [Streptomyces heliomycini]
MSTGGLQRDVLTGQRLERLVGQRQAEQVALALPAEGHRLAVDLVLGGEVDLQDAVLQVRESKVPVGLIPASQRARARTSS